MDEEKRKGNHFHIEAAGFNGTSLDISLTKITFISSVGFSQRSILVLVIFIPYMFHLDQIIHYLFHCYADDAQLYLP